MVLGVNTSAGNGNGGLQLDLSHIRLKFQYRFNNKSVEVTKETSKIKNKIINKNAFE